MRAGWLLSLIMVLGIVFLFLLFFHSLPKPEGEFLVDCDRLGGVCQSSDSVCGEGYANRGSCVRGGWARGAGICCVPTGTGLTGGA
ncbi:hypothetical protein JXA12_00300 [Candidatus Woesearchaeota archaeon]|nr:hypothetical protein [Candidatus Woesearchaeota archaeon]